MGEGEKKRKRKRRRREGRRRAKPKRYGTLDFLWKLNLCMDSMRLCMNFHAWLVCSLSPNMGFC